MITFHTCDVAERRGAFASAEACGRTLARTSDDPRPRHDGPSPDVPSRSGQCPRETRTTAPRRYPASGHTAPSIYLAVKPLPLGAAVAVGPVEQGPRPFEPGSFVQNPCSGETGRRAGPEESLVASTT